jgi:N-acetylglucosaminyldiphosphoundecaprenol N-acetyl-beta-D-mannosaminyltransferase
MAEDAAPAWTGADPSSRADCLGTRISALSFDGAQRALAALVERGNSACVSPATVYSVMLGVDDPAYRQTVNGAAMVTADGMPLVWLQRRLGWPLAERVHNDDLWFACCARYTGWRHFLVGGREGQPEVVAAALARRYPGIQVVGLHATPQRPLPAQTTRDIVARIREARPDIVWVGLGTPAQDWWMQSVAGDVGVPLVGVGSAFDLLAGRTRPAPEWMKRNGLQWLFRLAQEPRRLGWRYLHYNSRFVASVLWRWRARPGRGPVAP